MEKQERTVIHVEVKVDNTHHYFGSLAAIFEKFQKEEIGITYGSLRNCGLSSANPYQNAKCVIRKGILQTIEKGRNKEV